MNTIQFSDETNVPVLGQGTWKFGEGERDEAEEVAALRAGVELEMTLIDTAKMYGEGAAEKIVGRATEAFSCRKPIRIRFTPRTAARLRTQFAALGTDVTDLYLLHWRGPTPLFKTVEAFEALDASGKIRR